LITGPLIAAELGDLRRFASRRPLTVERSWMI
jgi:hypothetical protein